MRLPNVLRKLAARLAGPDQPAAPAAPPVAPPVREAAGFTVDDDDKGWRRLGGERKRDLTPLRQDQMQKLAAYLWEANMLANRLIELPLAYLLAEGVKLECADPEHQKWLDAFWHDPINCMDLRLPTYARELGLFGELCLPAYVNEVNGHVRLGYLDASLIADVMVDPGNPAQTIGVRTVKDAEGKVREFRAIVRGDDAELFAEAARQLRASYLSGDAFYFAVNKFAAGRRGRSDLIAQMDWLDGYDEFMFDSMERAADMDAFMWDVELEGASEADVEAKAAKIVRPGRNSVRVHNSQEKWTAVAPDIKAADRAEGARMFRNHALGGATIPEHWFGGGGDVNRGAASEMGEPFFKLATARQTHLRHMLQELGSYVLMQRARMAGQVPDWGDEAWKVVAKFPEMVTKDVTKLAAALQSAVAAVAAALGDRLITKATALQIIAIAARRLDVTIDPEQELAGVMEENPEPEGDDTRPGQRAGVPSLEPDDDGNQAGA
jgi:hypothetical protein